MLNVENVATPLTAFTPVVPATVTPARFAPIATVIKPVCLPAVFPAPARAAARTARIPCPARFASVYARFAAGGAGGAVMLNQALVVPVSPFALAVSV